MDGVEGQSGFLVTSVFNLTNANGVCNEELVRFSFIVSGVETIILISLGKSIITYEIL